VEGSEEVRSESWSLHGGLYPTLLVAAELYRQPGCRSCFYLGQEALCTTGNCKGVTGQARRCYAREPCLRWHRDTGCRRGPVSRRRGVWRAALPLSSFSDLHRACASEGPDLTQQEIGGPGQHPQHEQQQQQQRPAAAAAAPAAAAAAPAAAAVCRGALGFFPETPLCRGTGCQQPRLRQLRCKGDSNQRLPTAPCHNSRSST